MGLISINIFFHFIMHYVISCHVMLKATHFLLSLSYVLFYSFVLRPDGPHRRNAAASSAVFHPFKNSKIGPALAKAAYAAIGSF
jgi:sensor histidine kinase YesM